MRLKRALRPTAVPRFVSLGAHELGACVQVVALKHAPPPSMKMRSLVEAGLMLTPKPVGCLSRQSEPVTGTAVHIMGVAVIGSPGGTSTLPPPGGEPPEPPMPAPPEPVVPPPDPVDVAVVLVDPVAAPPAAEVLLAVPPP